MAPSPGRFPPLRRARGSRCRRRGALAAGLAALALAGAVAAWTGRTGPGPDPWTALVDAGERGTVPAGLRVAPERAARTAYLLAFHHAQDAGDPEHALAVADRLERLGEAELAAHVRRAAAALLETLGYRVPGAWLAGDPARAVRRGPGRTSAGSGSPGAATRGAPGP
jgi:hypothetical protein